MRRRIIMPRAAHHAFTGPSRVSQIRMTRIVMHRQSRSRRVTRHIGPRAMARTLTHMPTGPSRA